jgi:hypothetical protein
MQQIVINSHINKMGLSKKEEKHSTVNIDKAELIDPRN